MLRFRNLTVAAACLAAPDVEAMRACVALNIDCAQLCEVAAGGLARSSSVSGVTCLACSSVCSTCADECARHSNAHCQQCAAVCRTCAQLCAQMAS